MKIAVVGLPDFPTGKKSLIDQRLKELEPLIKPSKTTFISMEFLDASGLKDADAVICEKESKLDLIISDLEAVENRLAKGEDPLFGRAKEILEKNVCLSEEKFNEDERKILINSNLVSIKPAYFVDKNEGKDTQQIMLDAYYGLGMICFITGAKDKELRSWAIKKGATAPEAAGAIHSDIQRGFIKVEIIGYDDFIKAGGINQAKQFMRLEGKEYVMQDGDVVNFRFSV